ncbi:MAG: hypothetical protein HN736_09335, partial [Anaerolineae bacterium]|nr:hypothetical protein [Anaerolineae bacterium]MBT4458663.1 hypothetical protein [Anaerolineae bacterium]MBT7774900.1 hypothetical protein [Anaerolineae bacterium]
MQKAVEFKIRQPQTDRWEETPVYISKALSGTAEEIAKDAREIAVAGGKEELRKNPVLSLMQCTAPPLGHDGGSLDAALVAAEYGVPTG